MSEAGNVLKAVALKNGKQFAMDLVVEALPFALDEVKVMIPGAIDDAVIEMIKPILKEQLLKLIAKIG